jgi:3-isopropylmalate/(R)-2-methylmalate dehydratase small subunit
MTSQDRRAFARFSSTYVELPLDNVDTDQIIPARFLKVTDKKGLGDSLFADWRIRPDGMKNADFPLNRPDAAGAQILLTGANFGSGSSREHAPWALVGYGFRVVVALSFADIFRQNAMKNGLLPVDVGSAAHARLSERRRSDHRSRLTVDLPGQTLSFEGESEPVATFAIDPFAKHCLEQGTGELEYLLERASHIDRYEKTHPR